MTPVQIHASAARSKALKLRHAAAHKARRVARKASSAAFVEAFTAGLMRAIEAAAYAALEIGPERARTH